MLWPGALRTLTVRRLFGDSFFEEAPTYAEIVNRTPKLSPIVRLSSKLEGNKTQVVTSRGIEPRFTP